MTAAHTITITPADRHIEISLGGVKLAESDRALRLAETGLQDRYYLPREDVRTEHLRPTDTRTTCPFKGEASYWAIELDGEVHPDLVWSYEHPIPAAAGIAGLLCFYAEHVEQQVS
ncbi:MAG TPA: DUF427 domain-containing protein [Streptosporangiaceae bacterium]|jgi:uncharacterized protein (DUF427 family)